MSEAGGREWRFYLDDMIGFAEAALAYTENLDREGFVRSRINYDATLRNLELIGEAARNIPDAARVLAPDIPWRQVVALRNRLIHAYLGIDNDTLWSVIRDDLPSLLQALRQLKTQLSAGAAG